jgi:D-alanyl-D-alanine carboxypeptidase
LGSSKWIYGASGYIQDWLAHQKMMDTYTPGYSICLTHKGKVVINVALGTSNLANREMMTNHHLFRIASHSKTFTAVAVMQLVHNGKIKLDDYVSTYLPFLKNDLDPRIQTVTFQEVLSHFSGISRDGPYPPCWGLDIPFPDKHSLIKSFETQPLITDSGVQFKYSNYGYALLTIAIEQLSGLSYQDYMNIHIFRPLGLSNIGTEYLESAGKYASGYSFISPEGKQIEMPFSLETGYFKSAIGFYSTAEDLCKFYNALISDSEDIAPAHLKKIMLNTINVVPDTNSTYHYAFGFASETIEDFKLWGHAGSFPGQMTKTTFNFEDEIVISTLTNSYNGRPDLLQRGIWHILRFFKDNYKPCSSEFDFEGTYYDLRGPIRLTPLGENVFVTNPTLPEPFKSYSIAAPDGNNYKIVKETGFGSYGELLEVIRNGSKVEFIKYGGYLKYSLLDYENKLLQM